MRTSLLLGIASLGLLLPACGGLTATDKVDDTGHDIDTAADDTAGGDDTETGGGDQNAAPFADAGGDQDAMVTLHPGIRPSAGSRLMSRGYRRGQAPVEAATGERESCHSTPKGPRP